MRADGSRSGHRHSVQPLLNQAQRKAELDMARNLTRAVGSGRTYVTGGGRTVTAATVARNAARNLSEGGPLTTTHKKPR